MATGKVTAIHGSSESQTCTIVFPNGITLTVPLTFIYIETEVVFQCGGSGGGGALTYANAQALVTQISSNSGTDPAATTYGIRRNERRYAPAGDPEAGIALEVFWDNGLKGTVDATEVKPNAWVVTVRDTTTIIDVGGIILPT